MPTAVTEPTAENAPEKKETPESRTDRMWVALKAHVLHERARKRQEREAEVEEERLRRERQDVMTLGETRIQITELETRLAELKEEKHQLFTQLKKVLHEDDNRRWQLLKENEMLAAAPMLGAPEMNQQIYLSSGQQAQQGGTISPSAAAQYKPTLQTGGKRGRSPSPPQQQIPVTYAQQNPSYAAYKIPQQLKYQPTQQKEDQRRPHEFVRAVLWNKPSQYTNQPQANYYAVPPSADRTPIVYYPPQRGNEQVLPRAPPAIFDIYSMPPNVRPASQAQPTHVTVHGNTIPITPAQPVSKTGSITAGYPVRIVAPYQQPSQMYQIGAPPSGARPMYSSQSVAPLAGYPQQRE